MRGGLMNRLHGRLFLTSRFRHAVPMGLMLAFALTLAGCGFSIATPTSSSNGTVLPGDVSTPPPTVDGSANEAPVGFPDVVSVVERVGPSVVSVLTTVEQRDVFGRVRQGTTTGSGVIFDELGYILTNNHVVEDGVQVEVTLPDDPTRRWPVEVVGTDPLTDLAVLRLNPDDIPYQLVVTPLGDAESLRIGAWVVAIGSPLGLAGTVTVGIVSAKGRSLPLDNVTLFDLIQTDAVINPGNSGGPLLNLQGQVVGINTAIIRGRLASGQEAEGIGFAVSTTTAIPVAAQLIDNGEVVWPWLGVQVDNVTPSMAIEEELSVDSGVLVAATVPGGPADEAGIQSLDVIVSIGGRSIKTVTQLQRVLRTNHRIGETIEVEIIRNGGRLTMVVTLERMPR